MNKNKSAGDLLRQYMRWPLLFAVIMVLAAVSVFLVSREGAIVMAIWALAAIALVLIVYFSYRHSIMKALVGFAMSTEEAQNRLSQDLDVPYALMDAEGVFAWHNRAFNAVVSGDKAARKDISQMFAEIDAETIAGIESTAMLHGSYRDRKYRISIKKEEVDRTPVYAVYLYDETELLGLAKKYEDERPVVGLIYLDNYDELSDSVPEGRRAMLFAVVDSRISKYIAGLNGILNKLENDKYFFLVRREVLPQLEETRFDLLEDVKKVNVGNTMNVTCSIGIGLGADSMTGNYEYARMAIDMALARGGDQAVVKEDVAIRYYGGKSQSVEKSTRVKARVKAHAYQEILASKERVLIMGHSMMDIDCLGAAVGIWRIATSLGKKAHIVRGEINSSIRAMADRFSEGDYPADLFVDREQAMELADENSVLTVVDVNRPSITEAPELLDAVSTIVVFDHHRQSSESIGQAVLSYIEPYASSACEMVAEIVQYIAGDVKLKAVEADAMYGGIVIDTNNFTNRAGVRTFEAAAYLRKSGADVTRVRKLFRDNLEDYRAKAEAIHGAVIYRDSYAIAQCRAEGLESPTVVGAQAANELLNIVGIKASFVLTPFREKVYVSARAIDEVNVQVMMERLGGGGHRTVAGAQLEGVDMDGAVARIEELIDEMITKGELTES